MALSLNLPNVLVFGASPRALRTVRILRHAGCTVEVVADLPPSVLVERLVTGPVWLVRAGCWPVFPRTLSFPPPSATGRPLCALGRVRRTPDAQPDGEAERWDVLQRQCGGDLSHLEYLNE